MELLNYEMDMETPGVIMPKRFRRKTPLEEELEEYVNMLNLVSDFDRNIRRGLAFGGDISTDKLKRKQFLQKIDVKTDFFLNQGLLLPDFGNRVKNIVLRASTEDEADFLDLPKGTFIDKDFFDRYITTPTESERSTASPFEIDPELIGKPLPPGEGGLIRPRAMPLPDYLLPKNERIGALLEKQPIVEAVKEEIKQEVAKPVEAFQPFQPFQGFSPFGRFQGLRQAKFPNFPGFVEVAPRPRPQQPEAQDVVAPGVELPPNPDQDMPPPQDFPQKTPVDNPVF